MGNPELAHTMLREGCGAVEEFVTAWALISVAAKDHFSLP